MVIAGRACCESTCAAPGGWVSELTGCPASMHVKVWSSKSWPSREVLAPQKVAFKNGIWRKGLNISLVTRCPESSPVVSTSVLELAQCPGPGGGNQGEGEGLAITDGLGFLPVNEP